MALKFPPRSFRVGTVKDSVYSIANTVEFIQNSDKAIVQDLGSSPDGKSYYEWRIFPKNGMPPFAIYDYKLGLDPGDEDNFEEEFEFSVGGTSKAALESAKKLGFNVVSEGNINEDVNNHVMNLLKDLKSSLDPVEEEHYKKYEDSVMRDLESNDDSRINQYKTMDLETMKEDYFNYAFLDEMFVHQMKYKAGIIK